MLFQTAQNVEKLIEEMLDLIQDFDYQDKYEMPEKDLHDKGNTPRRRQQILGEKMNEVELMSKSVDVVSKSEETRQKLQTELHRHFLFSQLRDYELEDVIDVMQAQYVSEGEVIIEQGALDGDLFYILEEGQCEIFINGESLGFLESGASFGDLALLYNCPRAATIVATCDSSLWTLDRVFFRQTIMISSSNQNGQLTQFLSKISLFENLGDQNLSQLARSLTKQTYDDGKLLYLTIPHYTSPSPPSYPLSPISPV
jgi:CRP-like cAMP-binding protein